ncbi:MAG: phosphotransferase [Caldilineaceae bacterium]|nr:phosphotransferase [Caldilineaceae bacterium]
MNSQQDTPHKRELRVLIVENRAKTRQVHIDNIVRWGYEPIVAEGSGDRLLHNALKLAYSHCCHLALVDKRLRDDYDMSDTSGLDLIEQLKPTATVQVSGYTDHESTRAALRLGAIDVVAKRQGPKAVQNALQKAAEECWHPTVHIVWPLGWSAKRAIQLLTGTDRCSEVECADEADYVIARLFPKAKKVTLERLDRAVRTPRSGRIPALRRRSLVFLAHEDEKTPVILKLLPRSKAEKEQANYDSYIAGNIEGTKCSVMFSRTLLWRLGGHVYNMIGFSGAEFHTFDDLYAEAILDPAAQLSRDQQLIAILQELFGTTWRRNYENASISSGSLFQLYNQHWNEKLVQRIDSWRNRPTRVRKSKYLAVSICDPLRWLAENHAASQFPRITVAIVHGDLHGENILLDKANTAYVIDYEDTGMGHILRDYVELAQNILTRLHSGKERALTFYELAIALVRPRTPDEPMNLTHTIARDPAALCAFRILDAIRQFAHRFTKYNDSREFLWGLLLDIAKLEPLLAAQDRRRRNLLYLGGIICHRLEHWGSRQWPPTDWPQVKWLDAQMVLPAVEQTETKSPEFAKILFLAANPSGAVQLKLAHEVRSIREALRKAEARDRFAFAHEPAIRINDLIDHLLEHKPTIVHFSGHGSEAGEIIVEDDRGLAVSLPQESIQRIFAQFTDGNDAIRCVILNACFSEAQARLIAEHVDIVIGITSEIRDDVATRFATTFYSAIGAKTNVHKAFALACESINLNRLKPPDAIHLITRSGVDPHAYLLA